MLKYALSWLLLFVFAILNATIRELTYARYFAQADSHRISVFTGILLLAIPIYLIAKIWPFSSSKEAFRVGFLWALLTEIFELSMILSGGKSMQDFYFAHNVSKGEFWPLILVWLFVAPYLTWKIRNRKWKT
ncbi:hypothetical protein EHQ27_14515 [Leptospira wolffii]|uniref:hypothetical protein n=1 Tax=Leptospira wolffii TaxID=409998 RepID=UPI0003451E12|nr:hypothetical protein [Leptospira wolffii]TGK62314.1 hypothetical protein EHQ32_05685 [Leptospira wolffii]TGK68169.1 hypothetical protein EHQ27_14515 [Leptospira wolffii]TGK74302.1 hypothetical protein EHQ35_08090 [Leptospira wolffii]TGL32123.1 hypothetical protein EHQ57_04585 [Leptospira wolffii]